jgi:hypothetical protein
MAVAGTLLPRSLIIRKQCLRVSAPLATNDMKQAPVWTSPNHEGSTQLETASDRNHQRREPENFAHLLLLTRESDIKRCFSSETNSAPWIPRCPKGESLLVTLLNTSKSRTPHCKTSRAMTRTATNRSPSSLSSSKTGCRLHATVLALQGVFQKLPLPTSTPGLSMALLSEALTRVNVCDALHGFCIKLRRYQNVKVCYG